MRARHREPGDAVTRKHLLIGAGGIAAAIVVLFAVMLVRAVSLPPLPEMAARGTEAAASGADAMTAARHLAQAIRFATISYQEGSAPEGADAPFAGFHAWLEATYPAFHAAAPRENIANSLLYKWEGADPCLEPALMMAHMDVVPIAPGSDGDWEQPPFSGAIEGGFVWGRGAIDDKGSLVAIFEAVERLAAQGFKPARTLYFAFGADEELGGEKGNAEIAKLMQARGIKLAWVLDEGGVITQGIIPGVEPPVALIGVAEKGSVSIELLAHAEGGHSSVPPTDTAIGRLARAVVDVEEHQFSAAMDDVTRRQLVGLAPAMPFGQRLMLANLWLTEPLVVGSMIGSPTLAAQLRTTIAPTIVSGGVKTNVLPASARAVVNFRIHPKDTIAGVVAHVRAAIPDAMVDVGKTSDGREASGVSNLDGEPYRYLVDAIAQSFPGTLVAPTLTRGGTDSRFYLPITANVFRFIPITLTPEDQSRFHGTNERVSVADMGAAVAFYERFIRGMP